MTKNNHLILDHMADAVFTFNKKGKVQDGYSSVCMNYFGEDFTKNKVWDIIYSNKKQKTSFKDWCEFAFEAYMSFDESVGLAPKKCTLFNSVVRKEAYMSIQYSPITDENGSLEYIMVQMLDKSRETRICKLLEKKLALNELVLRILKNKESYLGFLSEANNCINKLDLTIQSLNQNNLSQQTHKAFNLAHTIKGNSATYGIISVRNIAHELENILNSIKESEASYDDNHSRQLKTHLASLRSEFRHHIVDMESIFRERFDPNKSDGGTFRMTENDLMELLQQCDQIKKEKNSPESVLSLSSDLYHQLNELKLIPVEIFVNPYKEMIDRLAQDLGKRIRQVSIDGGHCRIDRGRYESFFSSFTHLVRNAVDHGIESPDEREELGKDIWGHINISVSRDDHGIKVVLKDDGAGIDPEIVSSIAVKKGVITTEEKASMSDLDKQMLVFFPDFSTRDSVTMTSGRGVGMNAVLSEIEELGGSLTLQSNVGDGSTFIIELPKSQIPSAD